MERTDAVAAEITGWTLEPHQQVPEEGDQVHYWTRFVGTRDHRSTVGRDACAVDEKRIVLACSQVYMHEEEIAPDGTFTWDEWIPAEDPENVATMRFVPNDKAEPYKTCDYDPIYGGGLHRPAPPMRGDQL